MDFVSVRVSAKQARRWRDLKSRHVAVHLLEFEVEVAIAGLDGVHALPKVSSLPDILTKGGTDLDDLVANLSEEHFQVNTVDSTSEERRLAVL